MARLFLCDDDANYRELLRFVFQDSEHEVVGEGGDGQACIDTVAASAAEIVLLDINMPGMSGFEALPGLREAAPDAKIIILTSARAVDEEQRAINLGADGFIEKPMNIFALPHDLRIVLAAA